MCVSRLSMAQPGDFFTLLTFGSRAINSSASSTLLFAG